MAMHPIAETNQPKVLRESLTLFRRLRGSSLVKQMLFSISFVALLTAGEAQAKTLSIRCEFTDFAKRNVVAIFEIDSSLVGKKNAEGQLILEIDRVEFPGIPAKLPQAGSSDILVEGDKIKFANVAFDLGAKRAVLGSANTAQPTVLIELHEDLTGGREVPARCTE